jgi:predicted kinase
MQTDQEVPYLIMMAGLPGVGKSTIARELAKSLKFTLLNLDHLKDESIENELEQGRIAYDILFRLVDCQLSCGLSLIVDTCLTYKWLQKRLLEYASLYNAFPMILLCNCSSEIAKERVENRLISGSYLACDWKKHTRISSAFELSDDIVDIKLSTHVNPSDNVEQIINFMVMTNDYLRAGNTCQLSEEEIKRKIASIESSNNLI